MADLFSGEALGKTKRSRSKAAETRREDSRRGNAPPARRGEVRDLAEVYGNGVTGAYKRRGRPKEQDGTVVVSVRLPGDLLEAVDRVVEGSGHVYRDRSEFIRQTVAQAVPSESRGPSQTKIALSPEMEAAIAQDPMRFATEILEIIRNTMHLRPDRSK